MQHRRTIGTAPTIILLGHHPPPPALYGGSGCCAANGHAAMGAARRRPTPFPSPGPPPFSPRLTSLLCLFHSTTNARFDIAQSTRPTQLLCRLPHCRLFVLSLLHFLGKSHNSLDRSVLSGWAAKRGRICFWVSRGLQLAQNWCRAAFCLNPSGASTTAAADSCPLTLFKRFSLTSLLSLRRRRLAPYNHSPNCLLASPVNTPARYHRTRQGVPSRR